MSTEVLVLGPTRVWTAGVEVPLAPIRRRLVAILALDRREPVTTEALIHRMWPDRVPATARTALHVHISKVRDAVPGLIETTADGYRLGPSAGLDVETFESLVVAAEDAAASEHWAEVLDLCDDCLRMWGGDPFGDISEETYALPVAVRLGERRHEVDNLRLQALLATGRNDLAVPHAVELVQRYPYSERFREGLMLALYRSGRQADAVRVYQEAHRFLGEELGVEPGPELRELEERILAHDPSLGPRPRPPTPHSLPRFATSFVGREEQLEILASELRPGRVVSVVGDPGVGKTRLAVEAAGELLDRFPGGVWFVDLGGATSALSVAATVARATRTTEVVESLNSLGAMVASRPVLVVLDECELVLDHVRAFLEGFGGGAPHAAVLATSRVGLGIEGQSEMVLRSFHRRTHVAVRLIVDRIRAVDRSFVLDEEAFRALTSLVEAVDGVPLALEIVARWVPTLGIGETTRLLGDVSAGSALETAFDWSFRLLHRGDRALLGAFSVFSAPFTLARGHSICAEPGTSEFDTAGSISRLVEASLLATEGPRTGTVRYRMPGPVRDLASARLTDRGEVFDRHAAEFRAAAVATGAAANNEGQAAAFAAAEVELADLRQAMAHLRDVGDWDGSAEIAAGLARFWYSRFLGWEGRVWLDESLARPLSPGVESAARMAAGFLAWAVHDYETADRHYRARLEEGRKAADVGGVADALYGLGLIHQKRRFEDGAAMLDEAAELYRSLPGRELELGQCLLFRGLHEVGEGRTSDGVPMLEEAVELLTRAGHLRQVSKAHRWLAHAAWLEGRGGLGRRHAATAEDLARSTGDQPALAGALIELAFLDMDGREFGGAAKRLAEALALIPQDDLVDVCQVLTPVAWLAELAGEPALAGRVLAFIDSVYDDSGWLPANSRMCVRRLEARLASRGECDRPEAEPPSKTEVMAGVGELLTRLVEGAPGGGSSALAADDVEGSSHRRG